MKPLDPRSVRDALIVAPHPDDETIGAFGLMRRLRRRGARVRVLVVSDGAASHADSPSWPAARLARARRDESRRVLRAIGIGADAVTFLGLPDSGLSKLNHIQRRKLTRALARSTDLLVVPSADDEHPDHRAVAAIVASVPLARRRMLAYAVWPPRSHRAGVGLRLGVAQPVKRGALLRYRTQNGLITDDPRGCNLSRAEIAAFTRPIEMFAWVRR